MHLLEDLGLLAADLEAHAAADLAEFGGNVLEGRAALREVNDHHHVEVVLNDGLRDVEDVDLRLREMRAGPGENADRVFSDNCYYRFLHMLSVEVESRSRTKE